MNRARITIALFIGSVTLSAGQVPAALTVHDLAAMPKYPFGGMQARGAMGQHASMFIANVPPGGKTTPHHHHQEQFMLGVEGALDFVLAGSSPQRLAALTAAFAPANVQHGNVNGDAPTTYVEFQPVLRPDWYPPHPRRPREGTPTPQPIPEGLKVAESFAADSTGWRTEGQARSKSLTGKTARVTVWQLPRNAKAVDITAENAMERFVFVIDGTPSITDGSSTRELAKEALVIVAGPARGVLLTAPKQATARVAIFEALK